MSWTRGIETTGWNELFLYASKTPKSVEVPDERMKPNVTSRHRATNKTLHLMKDSRFKDCNAGSANSEHLHEMPGPQEGQPGVRSFVRSSDHCFMAPSTGLRCCSSSCWFTKKALYQKLLTVQWSVPKISQSIRPEKYQRCLNTTGKLTRTKLL